MDAGRTQTTTDGMTARQWREALADMAKGGTGEAMGVIREDVRDGRRCYVVRIPNPNGSTEPLACVCDTKEHAQALLDFDKLKV